MKKKSELEQVHNTARYFVESRPVALALLFFVVIAGVYAYKMMPKRKDPDIPVRVAMITTQWAGHSAMEVEELVTKPVEKKIAESEFLKEPSDRDFSIQSITIPGLSMVQVQLRPGTNRDVAFNGIGRKLSQINAHLPDGAGPIQLNSGFGDTAAVMLSVASPMADDIEIHLRAKEIVKTLGEVRTSRGNAVDRAAVIVAAPYDVNTRVMQTAFHLLGNWFREDGFAQDVVSIQGAGFIGIDFLSELDDASILKSVDEFLFRRFGAQQFYPDSWAPVVLRKISDVETQLKKVAGSKYSYRQLDDFSDSIAANLKVIPQVSRVLRSGVLPQQVHLVYSQNLLAAYGVMPSTIKEAITQRNTTIPGGVLQAQDMNVLLTPSGEFTNIQEIGDVVVSHRLDGSPVYLRSIMDIQKGYRDPPQLLSYHTKKGKKGKWQRRRSITVAVQMHSGQQINDLGIAVDEKLQSLSKVLPEDLVVTKVSDQPVQVAENVSLFMDALYEAIILVVLIALIGFWEWRSAVLLMFSIPITLAMTFCFIYVLGIDLQQVSIAAMIIALGLLVDDPVVANDAIKNEMAAGASIDKASWMGPTRLAKAIMFATITNIVAYLPFLLISGNTGDFLYSLPVVMASALVSSRIVSMTFIPFLASILLKVSPKPPPTIETQRKTGITGAYYRFVGFSIDHRKVFLLVALMIIVVGFGAKKGLKNAFFPDDVQYLSTVDVWLKNDASITTTNKVAHEVEAAVILEAKKLGVRLGLENPNTLLESITTTVGAGAPRFWFTVSPEQQLNNYAQLVVRLNDKTLTPRFAPELQNALNGKIPGADIDVKQLQTNPVTYPIAIRISAHLTPGSDHEQAEIRQLRGYAEKVKAILRNSQSVRSARDDWGQESFSVKIDVDQHRANMAGLTNQDIAISSVLGISGVSIGTLRQGDKQIPLVARLRLDQRASVQDVENLYIYSNKNGVKVPLAGVATSHVSLETQLIRRLEQFRTITVFAFPAKGALTSEIMTAIEPALQELKASLPDSFELQISGEHAQTMNGFSQLSMALLISALGIFMALVVQFKNLVKPFVVFAAVPFGMVGAVIGLVIMGEPFSFMAFLGMVSLVGVIVSHIIVLFDYIEERHDAGDPFKEALLDAGIMRLRPITITIAATTLALIPLAFHGGPLWQGLCYAQIGGLVFAMFGTLIFIPTLYAFAVLDLKVIPWNGTASPPASS